MKKKVEKIKEPEKKEPELNRKGRRKQMWLEKNIIKLVRINKIKDNIRDGKEARRKAIMVRDEKQHLKAVKRKNAKV